MDTLKKKFWILSDKQTVLITYLKKNEDVMLRCNFRLCKDFYINEISDSGFRASPTLGLD